MSYCVNCGVELGASLKECPLCNTEVINPKSPDIDASPYFPTRNEEIKPVSKLELAMIITAMLVSISLLSGLINIFIGRGVFWSLYVLGASAMLWVWFVLPLLVKVIPPWTKLAVNVSAVALYVLIIAFATNGIDWFLSLALPILLSAVVIILIASFIVRDGRCSILQRLLVILTSIAVFAVIAEYFADLYFIEMWAPAWSVLIFAICMGMAIPIIIVLSRPSLREEVRKRFHI
ncbi:MAG: zinc ribbon domain-containing protein [Ruminococcaceae bacterium]|nr:zinc ribbon domain-containing protein [Oscillospiraceae bacterium]